MVSGEAEIILRIENQYKTFWIVCVSSVHSITIFNILFLVAAVKPSSPSMIDVVVQGEKVKCFSECAVGQWKRPPLVRLYLLGYRID